MKIKTISLFEIYLLVMFSVAFAYIVSETNELSAQLPVDSKESKFIEKLRNLALNYLSQGLVSAQGAVLNTCQQSVSGTVCQEYPSTTCNSECTTACFPGPRNQFAACQLGTCFDPLLGTCNDGTPQFSCQNAGGQWSASQPAQCNRECCLINPNGNGGAGDAQFATQQQCNYLSGLLGAPVSWVPVNNELECLLMTNSQAQGACVLELIPEENKYNCEFTTQADCLTSGGDFNEGHLCTNSALNTICERTQQTQCFDEFDEVYYIDSCGNRANIYDSTKLNDVSYWSTVVPKVQSCALGTSNNLFANQARCGNCAYLGGSTCGTPVPGKDTTPIYGSNVCRDLECIDEWGDTRKNGESWCAFDGRIGVVNEGTRRNRDYSISRPGSSGPGGSAPGRSANFVFGTTTNPNAARSVDVPGSGHYRRLCFDGEVTTEPCAGSRTEVCSEETDTTYDFTSAACRVNAWQLCYGANDDAERLNKCEENSACFLKNVDIEDTFTFDMCAPRYPPGFDLDDDANTNVAETFCAFASQSCTYIEEKQLFTGWTCVVNCECKEQKFTEAMNNLCISLGDCGGHVNTEGKFSGDGYSVRGAPRLSQAYINRLIPYSTPVQGQSAKALSNSELAAIFGYDPATFTPTELGNIIGQIGLGAIGVVAAGQVLGVFSIYSLPPALGVGAVPIAGTGAEGIGIAAGAYGGAAIGAAVGAGIGYLIGSLFGLQGQGLTIAVIAGAVAGAIIGASTFTAGSFASSAAFFTALGALLFWVIIIVIIIVIILSVLGIGDIREKRVKFECLPWEPPAGGDDCNKCGADGLPCSSYKCDSLGKSCEYINEGTSEAACIDINPNDVSAPIININPLAISQNYTYTNTQVNIGTEIENTINSDGCVKEYSAVNFGILLNEPGQCKTAEERTPNYESMEQFFGTSNSYTFNHTMPLAVPTLDELGVSGVDPNRRGDYNLYVRCQDSSGNPNENEYIVQLCVRPADDVTPPVITRFVPPSPGYTSLSQANFSLGFYTNEPASCKWSQTANTNFDSMEGFTLCQNELTQITLNGWQCQAVLPVSGNMTSNYYLRCRDQPWLGLNDSRRNTDNQDTSYQIQKTATPLLINYVAPNGTTISTGSWPVGVDLEVHTTGGLNGNALCEYSLDNGNRYIGFLRTGAMTHTQHFTSLPLGQQNILLRCTDWANNIAYGISQFTIAVDSQGPLITHVYSSGASLNVITNEASTCAYTTTNCGFDFTAGTLLSGSGQSHAMSYDNGITYRIKCRDSFGNAGTCLSASGGY